MVNPPEMPSAAGDAYAASAPTSQPTPLEPATREPVGPFRLCVLSSIFFGVAVTEACSVNLLPLTLALLTKDPQVIFLVLAINPAFGFIAQPLAGFWSDRVWTRFGRRAVFLIVCAPLVALSLVAIPFVSSLVMVVVLVVWLQFFQDMLNGTDQPLLADLVPPAQRTVVMGVVKSFDQLGFLCVLYFGMAWVGRHEAAQGGVHFGLPLYLAAAGCQFVFVLLPAFFLGEKRIDHPPRPKLTVKRYVQDFVHQPMLPTLAVSLFLRAFTKTAVFGSVALYATQTLQLSKESFGGAWAMMPFVALVLAIPLGLAAERFAKQRVMQVAFAVVIASCLVGYFTSTIVGLTVAAFLFGFGDMLIEVTQKPFMSEHYPKDIIGQLAGCINVFFALGRTFALVFVGWCVKWVNPAGVEVMDYHVIWIISGVSALLGILLLQRVRDFRHEARRNGE